MSIKSINDNTVVNYFYHCQTFKYVFYLFIFNKVLKNTFLFISTMAYCYTLSIININEIILRQGSIVIFCYQNFV